MPYEIVRPYLNGTSFDEVLELQWKAILAPCKSKGSLSNSLCICDLGPQMIGVAREATFSLALFISELSEPFNNVVIPFSENPILYKINGTTLKERVESLSVATYGATTNLLNVFEMILHKAKTEGGFDMPKRIFILSHMQFDPIANESYTTNHVVIKEKFESIGYRLPEIIYWNLMATSSDFPVTVNDFGVAMVSGFNTSILKVFMEQDDFMMLMDPFSIVRKAIDIDRYRKITLPNELRF